LDLESVTTFTVLSVNAGSSTLKLALFDVDVDGEGERERWRSQVEVAPGSSPDLTPALVEIAHRGLPEPAAIGHRVVHGGAGHVAPELIDAHLLADLERLAAFAPLHQPVDLAGVRAATDALPGRPQVACFDTAFHHTLGAAASALPLPPSLRARGLRRFGFHGLSYEFVVAQLRPVQPGRMVIAHLGAGASLCAVVDGRSVDTTMGLTPTGGLVMATRSGDLDPGVVVELLRHPPPGLQADADGLEDLLNHQSGLRGLSGRSGDMRDLLEAEVGGDADAALAVEVFCRTVSKQVAALATVLTGLDTLVFTGGIGQHSAPVRARICQPLSFLGVDVVAERNQTGAGIISAAGGVTVRVVPTDEERIIARHTASVVQSTP
jgi:acetate kinase